MGVRLNWPAGDKLGAHSLRCGEARSLMSAGGKFARLLRAGKRHGNAVRFYLDLSAGERGTVAGILIEGSEDEPL